MARQVTRGNLKPEDEFKIRENYEYLLEEIDAKYLIPTLFSKGVIDGDDKEEIEETKRRSERNKLLLKSIMKSGNGRSFDYFIEALSKNYDHVVRRLQDTRPLGIQPDLKPYAWFEAVDETVKKHVVRDADASRIATHIGVHWDLLMFRLGFNLIEIEKEKCNTSISSDALRITRLLIKWRQKVVKAATIEKLFSCLMELEDSQSLTIDWEGLRKFIESIELL